MCACVRARGRARGGAVCRYPQMELEINVLGQVTFIAVGVAALVGCPVLDEGNAALREVLGGVVVT